MSAHFVQILFPKCKMRAAAIQYCKQNMDKSGLPEQQICEPQDQTLYLFSASDRYQRHGMLFLQHIDDLPDLVDHNYYIGLKTLQPTMHCNSNLLKAVLSTAISRDTGHPADAKNRSRCTQDCHETTNANATDCYLKVPNILAKGFIFRLPY